MLYIYIYIYIYVIFIYIFKSKVILFYIFDYINSSNMDKTRQGSLLVTEYDLKHLVLPIILSGGVK